MKESEKTPVGELYGVGPAKAAAYEKLGIRTLHDLVFHFPRSYEHRGDIRLLSEAPPDARCGLLLTIGTEVKSARVRGRMSILKFKAFDESGVCEISYFNQEYLKKVFLPGLVFRFYGKVERRGRRFLLNSPAYEPYDENTPLPELLPVYRLSGALTQKLVEKNVRAALAAAALWEDPLPEEIRLREKLVTRARALRDIHNPDSFLSLAAAKKRLIFDEFFFFALGLSLSAGKAREGSAPPCPDDDLSPFLSELPFALTGAQRRVIGEICADMKKTVPMSRMVVGDVGCGKTVCAAAALYLAVKNGRQAALMAPTEILARQHATDLEALFSPLGIRVALLVGSTPAAEKKKIKAALSAADPQKRLPIVIGTQALLSDGVTFAAPGVVVTDEQHRFGVRQRARLSEKNEHAHLLVMSATPIPRSLALAFYGDLDLSRVDEMPAGRERVETFVVDESYRERLLAFIQKQCAVGGQVYVVCPAVGEREAEPDEVLLSEIGEYLEKIEPDAPPMKAAVTYAAELSAALPELSVALVHGQMKSREKDETMKKFVAGEIQVLVSTTVIEVGVNVPNATLMIVENADRFGLSQLHQLRGRVGRGKRKSYCVLVTGRPLPPGSPAAARLATMKNTYDGFDIAEKDLALRGPGDFLSGSPDETIRQSGGVRFRLANLCDDTGLLTRAFEDARELAAKDPELSAHPALREAARSLFTLDTDTVS